MFFTLGVPCIHPVYFGLRPFAPFQYILLIKKKVLSNTLGSLLHLMRKQKKVKMIKDVIFMYHIRYR
jgi:hypothetical protein